MRAGATLKGVSSIKRAETKDYGGACPSSHLFILSNKDPIVVEQIKHIKIKVSI